MGEPTAIDFVGIAKSQDDFDITRPLTDAELEGAGHLMSLPGRPSPKARPEDRPLLMDLDVPEPPDGELEPSAAEDYNSLYAHYLSCQALVALASFKEGWDAFEGLLSRYVVERRRENSQYRGHDPNESMALRLKQQGAEDFRTFIRSSVNEAAAVKMPSLKK